MSTIVAVRLLPRIVSDVLRVVLSFDGINGVRMKRSGILLSRSISVYHPPIRKWVCVSSPCPVRWFDSCWSSIAQGDLVCNLLQLYLFLRVLAYSGTAPLFNSPLRSLLSTAGANTIYDSSELDRDPEKSPVQGFREAIALIVNDPSNVENDAKISDLEARICWLAYCNGIHQFPSFSKCMLQCPRNCGQV